MNITLQTKNFVFENQITQIPTIISSTITVSNVTNIIPILEKLSNNYDNMKYKIYNFQTNTYQDLQQICDVVSSNEVNIPWKFIQTDVILIKYSFISGKSSTLSQSGSEISKKQRSRERTISEVLTIIKKWRQLHLNNSSLDINVTPNRKINLQQAATLLGISKKSLDDYYYQLRLGQKYGFNFKDHLDDKIGVLRTFIKEIKPKGRKNDRNEKMPKNLKILDQLGDIMSSQSSLSYRSKSRQSQKVQNIKKQQIIEQEEEQIYLNQQNLPPLHGNNFMGIFNYMGLEEQYEQKKIENIFKGQQYKSIEEQFQNQFGFNLYEPFDPFVNLGHQVQSINQFTKKNEKPIIEHKIKQMTSQYKSVEEEFQNNYYFH